MTQLAQKRPSHVQSLVSFVVGDVTYAVDIHRVREIIRPLSTVPMPHAPPTVIGVAHHRGDVVPVIDLRARFGLEPRQAGRDPRWIIVRRTDRFVGLAVDRVSEVFTAREPQKRLVPALGGNDELRGFTSVYTHRGSLVFVVDVDVIASAARDMDLSAAHELLSSGEIK